ncbi:MAG: glycosyltransferase family 4 protein [Cyclobacteriaceae bacterium]|nr:glycosyltransferase family 4 protein [Cyclobacteriaceae bacterium]
MRIGIEAQRLFRKEKHGMDVVILELIKELQLIDKSNEYFIYIKDDLDRCINETTNFKIRLLPRHNYAYWEQVVLPRAAMGDRVNILHCTSNTGPVFYKGKIILTLHDIIYLEKITFSRSAYQNFGNLYRRFIVPRVVKISTHIITVSNFEKGNITNYFKTIKAPVTVVYNGVSDLFRKKQSTKSLDKINLKDFPDDYILFLGNTAHKKNTIGLLKAYQILLSEIENAPTLVITDVSRSYIKQLLEKLGARELESKIYICGYIPYSDMILLYGNSRLFVYPSLRESFGMPILEAMASGTPVITSNVTSMPEIAGESATLVDPHNPFEIADGIRIMLENKDNIVKDKVELGYKHSLKFSWKESARKLLSIYEMYR